VAVSFARREHWVTNTNSLQSNVIKPDTFNNF
jgi:hypothetical protein